MVQLPTLQGNLEALWQMETHRGQRGRRIEDWQHNVEGVRLGAPIAKLVIASSRRYGVEPSATESLSLQPHPNSLFSSLILCRNLEESSCEMVNKSLHLVKSKIGSKRL